MQITLETKPFETIETEALVTYAFEEPGVQGRIELDRVTFAYGVEPVLRDVSLRLAPGRVLGLVGRTGSGKTTIARLLVRLYLQSEFENERQRRTGFQPDDGGPESCLSQSPLGPDSGIEHLPPFLDRACHRPEILYLL